LLLGFSKLEFRAEAMNKEWWVHHWDGVFSEKNLAAEELEYLRNREHVHLNGIGKVNKQVRTVVDATGHVEACSCDYFVVSALSEWLEVNDILFGYC
jgi:stage V sporulation protein SpoVS